MGLTVEGSWFNSQQGQEIFTFSKVYSFALGPTQASVQWVLGAVSLSLKQLVQEADHKCPSTAEVTNEWNYISIHPYIFIVCAGTPRCLMMMVMLMTLTVVVKTFCNRNDSPCFHFRCVYT